MSSKIFTLLALVSATLMTTETFAMFRALNTAASGMATQEMNVSTISHNLANANTTGFKRSRVEAEDLLYETTNEAGGLTTTNTQASIGTQVGTGSKVSGTKQDFTQGSPMATNNPFDLMINGEGFFGVMMPNGTLRFTRDGSFNVDAQGNFVTKHGYKVFPGFIFPPNSTNIHVADTGIIEVFSKEQADGANIGQIPIFTFVNMAGLKPMGANLFKETSASGQPIQNIAGQSNAGSISQGSLEASNSNAMLEMTELIKAQRVYEMNSKVMGVADQMLQTINNIK